MLFQDGVGGGEGDVTSVSLHAKQGTLPFSEFFI